MEDLSTFPNKLLELSKADLESEANELRLELENASYSHLRQKGKIVYPLEVHAVKTGLFGRVLVQLSFSNRYGGDMHNSANNNGHERARFDYTIPSTFKVGTIVELFRKSKNATNKYGLSTNMKKRGKSVSNTKNNTNSDIQRYNGVVTRVSRRAVSVVLHRGDGDDHFELEAPIVLQLVSDVVTFERMARALRRLKQPEREESVVCDSVLQVLFRDGSGRSNLDAAEFKIQRPFIGINFTDLGQASHCKNSAIPKSAKFICWQNRWFNQGLNQEQKEAVAMFVGAIFFT